MSIRGIIEAMREWRDGNLPAREIMKYAGNFRKRS